MIGKSFFARTTPVFAAALNERSSLPPMSKTMPTFFFPASASATKSRVAHPPNNSEQQINRIRKSLRPMLIDYLRSGPLPFDQAHEARLLWPRRLSPTRFRRAIAVNIAINLDYRFNQRRRVRRVVCNPISRPHTRIHLFEFRFIIVISRDERIAGVQIFADLGVEAQADGVIDPVFQPSSPSAPIHHDAADLIGFDADDKAGAAGGDRASFARLRQEFRVVKNSRVAALRLYAGAEAFERPARRD